ncbi:uncharacterized protein THITE_160853 [Thermothielavioides terrestris NRRL 8126]|uniref:Uncharacterized protein n=1 Tax=Thermothielavioides terrestris (strain ATCC 38088 / NRRL 8126) TaxID=578455 RepID=G2R5S7_THETT|nr:uncharacterized protein THITE_160853 [Thermothielavioides terrestris NRRL 8126]AEO67516.1 hypothetical protein THITE_160853 [Thermothielavioides terrestris NRRL 8126]
MTSIPENFGSGTLSKKRLPDESDSGPARHTTSWKGLNNTGMWLTSLRSTISRTSGNTTTKASRHTAIRSPRTQEAERPASPDLFRGGVTVTSEAAPQADKSAPPAIAPEILENKRLCEEPCFDAGRLLVTGRELLKGVGLAPTKWKEF